MTMVREEWVDAAKGIAIILVVLFHVVISLDAIGMGGVWSAVSGPLDTFRMPLFFFTAGLFAQRAVQGTLATLIQRRVARLVWIYALWTLIWYVVFALVPAIGHRPADDVGPIVRWLTSFVWPNESTWFVYALAWYFLLAWSLRRLPVAVQLSLAVAVSAAVGSSFVELPDIVLEKAAAYFVFFLIAVHIGPRVRGVVARTPARRMGIALVVASTGYVLLSALVLAIGALAYPGVRVGLGAVGVLVGVSLASVLCRIPVFSWVTALGARTLPVYLLHFYIVLAAAAALAPFAAAVPPWSTILIPPALTASAVLGSLAIYRATRRAPGLWALPWSTRAVAHTGG